MGKPNKIVAKPREGKLHCGLPQNTCQQHACRHIGVKNDTIHAFHMWFIIVSRR